MGNERSALSERETLHPTRKRELFSHVVLPPISYPEQGIPSPFPFGRKTILASGKDTKKELHDKSLADFEAGNEQMEAIYNVGFQTYINNARRKDKNVDQQVHDSFPSRPSCVCCMDERVVSQESNGIFIAGSGILIKDSWISRRNFIKQCKRAGIKDVRLHRKCGAVGIYATIKGISLEQAEKDAVEWAHTLAKKLGGRVIEPPYEVHPEYHVARAVYYDMTGQFNPSYASGTFPTGFVVSRKHVYGRDGEAQVVKAIEIAFGHGYNQHFTEKHPLYLVAVAKNSADLRLMTLELNAIVNKWANPTERRKIRVDVFLMSKLEPEKPQEQKTTNSGQKKDETGNGTEGSGSGKSSDTEKPKGSDAQTGEQRGSAGSVPNTGQRRGGSPSQGGSTNRERALNRKGGFGFMARTRESIGNMFRSLGRGAKEIFLVPARIGESVVNWAINRMPLFDLSLGGNELSHSFLQACAGGASMAIMYGVPTALLFGTGWGLGVALVVGSFVFFSDWEVTSEAYA